jgi:hypothetical protein
VPSQYGGFFVCLHPQNATRLFSWNSTSSGANSVPVCDPSQKGCVLERPHRHQYTFPGPTSITYGLRCAMTTSSAISSPWLWVISNESCVKHGRPVCGRSITQYASPFTFYEVSRSVVAVRARSPASATHNPQCFHQGGLEYIRDAQTPMMQDTPWIA